MSSSLRRLAADHISLRRTDLPPNYLFPPTQDGVLPDDLTQLTILLTGARDTPYAQGLWQLQLRMSTDYPKIPPKAIFKTRIWHPNVDESTGAVCLDTLKRDWDPNLTLRDILLTITCLLIHPNPDSALNSAAGSLLQDNYEGFAEQARLMTSIHARIPPNLRSAVDAARRRGEEDQSGFCAAKVAAAPAPRMILHPSSTIPRKKLPSSHLQPCSLVLMSHSTADEDHELLNDEEDHDPSKENDPSQCPSPVIQSPRSPRKNVLGKRPLYELPTPTDPEDGMTESRKNITINQIHQNDMTASLSRPTKSPKLAVGQARSDVPVRSIEETSEGPFAIGSHMRDANTSADDKKENSEHTRGEGLFAMTRMPIRMASEAAHTRPTVRKVSNVSQFKGKQQPRLGIRRL